MSLLTYPKFSVQDVNGLNLSGGKVYFYAAGTATPKDTYTDNTLGTANPNPVVLDSRGEADIYLSGDYKIILKDADEVEIWTIPDTNGTLLYTPGLEDNATTVQITLSESGADITALTLDTALAITEGGTGQVTAQAAIDALTGVSNAVEAQVLTKDASGNATFKNAGGSYIAGWETSLLDDKYWNKVRSFDNSVVSTLNYGASTSLDEQHMIICDVNLPGVAWLKFGLAGDISTMYDTGKSETLSAQFTWCRRAAYNDDGSKMYACYPTVGICEYTLSTNYDVSTSTYVSTFYPTNVDDFHFNPDGTKLVYCNDDNGTVYTYTLSTGFLLSSASSTSSKDISTWESTPTNVTLSNDGLTMFTQGNTNNPNAQQFTLSTAFDVSTATFDYEVYCWGIGNPSAGFHLNVAGDTLYTNVSTADTNYATKLSSPNDLRSLSYHYPYTMDFINDIVDIYGMEFSPDGTHLYLLEQNGGYVMQYDLSTAWDIRTATYADNDLYVGTQAPYPAQDLCLSLDGQYIYVVTSNGDDISQYKMTTPWDISTASWDNKTLDISTADSVPTSIFITPDGYDLYIGGTTNDAIQKWTMTTPWIITTAATATQTTGSLVADIVNLADFTFRPDGLMVWIVDSNTEDVTEYPLSTAWDVSTIGSGTVIFTPGATRSSFLRTIDFSADGGFFYFAGITNTTIAAIPCGKAITGF